MNMTETSQEYDIKVEIQKKLLSINHLVLEIQNELNTINGLINGHLQTAITDANTILTTIAENMGIDVENILSNIENENELPSNLRTILSPADFQERIINCLSNISNKNLHD